MIFVSTGISLCATKNTLRSVGSAICRRKYRVPEDATTITGASGVPTLRLSLLSTSRMAGGAIRRFVVDRSRSRLVVGFQSGAIGSVSLPDLTPGPRLEDAHDGKAEGVKYLALSPDGRLLASGGSDHRVVLRDAQSFAALLSFPVWAGTLRDLTFDATGRRLAVVGTESDVDLWDIAALHDGLTAIGLAWDQPSPQGEPRHD